MTINHQNLAFHHPNFLVYFRPDHQKVDVRSNLLFNKIIKQDILGRLEMFDATGENLLKANDHLKVNFRNEIITKGWSSDAFLSNKLEEIWISQLNQQVLKFIREYENPNEWNTFRKEDRINYTLKFSEIQASNLNE